MANVRNLNADEQFEASRALARLVQAAQSENKLEAYKEAAEVGLQIRNEINQNKFEGGTFYTVLLLSLIGDISGIVTLGTIGYLIDKVIAICLFFVFFLQVSYIKKYLIKKFIWPVVVKFIPILGGLFPSYTISTIMLKLKMDKKKKELYMQLDEVEQGYSKFNKEFVYA